MCLYNSNNHTLVSLSQEELAGGECDWDSGSGPALRPRRAAQRYVARLALHTVRNDTANLHASCSVLGAVLFSKSTYFCVAKETYTIFLGRPERTDNVMNDLERSTRINHTLGTPQYLY